MSISKAEVALYTAGGLSILGALLLRKRTSSDVFRNALIFGTGTLVTAGVMTGFRLRQQQKALAGIMGRAPLGLENTETYTSGGHRLKVWSDPNMGIKERVYLLQGLVAKSVKDPMVRKLALAVTGHGRQEIDIGKTTLVVEGAGCPARDDMCELRAIFDWVSNPKNVRYTGDTGPHALTPGGVVEPVDEFQTAIRTVDYRGGDCLPISTLVLRDDYQLVPIVELAPGDRIMSDGHWTVVQDMWLTGEKPILAFDLNNGCVLRCSPDHRVFRVVDGEIEEVRADQVRPGDDLLTPDQIPVAAERPLWPIEQAHPTLGRENLHWLIGTYIADGWHEKNRFAIAGRDGKPKEEQKRTVQALMEAIGVDTRWHERYIAVNNRDWAQLMALHGGHAPEKHVEQMRFNDVVEVRSLVDGLMADGGAGGRDGKTFVHSTTSSQLALQLRILYRMLGQSVHVRRVDNHGGLGTHPIYRITVRSKPEDYDTSRTSVRRWARVRGVRTEATELCADMTVDRGRFWLPEADVIVHNCDDHAVLAASLAIKNGFPAKFRITSNDGDTWDHIYTMVGVPKLDPKKWIALDSTLGPGKFNVQPRRAKEVDFAA